MDKKTFEFIGQAAVAVGIVLGFGVGSWLVSILFVNWLNVAWWVAGYTGLPFLVAVPISALPLLIPGTLYVIAQEAWRRAKRSRTPTAPVE